MDMGFYEGKIMVWPGIHETAMIEVMLIVIVRGAEQGIPVTRPIFLQKG